jgi:hypothetical protein
MASMPSSSVHVWAEADWYTEKSMGVMLQTVVQEETC